MQKGLLYFKITLPFRFQDSVGLSSPAKQSRDERYGHKVPAPLAAGCQPAPETSPETSNTPCCCCLILLCPSYGAVDHLQRQPCREIVPFFRAIAWVLVPAPGLLNLIRDRRKRNDSSVNSLLVSKQKPLIKNEKWEEEVPLCFINSLGHNGLYCT